MTVRKTLLTILFMSSLFLAVMFTLYFFFYLKPATTIPRMLLDIEKQTTRQYLVLVENRTAIVGITKMDPGSVHFNDDKNKFFDMISKTQKDGTENLKSSIENDISAPGNEKINTFYNEVYIKRTPKLEEEVISLFEKEKPLIEEYKMLSETSKRIYDYYPELDLNLDPAEKKEELLERLTRANKGLGDTAENIEKSKNLNSATYKSGIQDIQLLMKEMETSLNEGKLDEFKQKLIKLTQDYKEMKISIYKAEVDYLVGDEYKEVVKDLTNVLMEYEYILDKLEVLKSDFSKKSLFRF